MRRSSYPHVSSMSFGPGPISTVLKALIASNVIIFALQHLILSNVALSGGNGSDLFSTVLGLGPADVVTRLWVWQPVTYMFLHVGLTHILFNMLALWMFGGELERIWGTRFFLRFYLASGVGAAVLTLIVSSLPFDWARALRHTHILGASGAIYGLLLAYGLTFPNRPIYMYFLFPIPAKYFVLIMGAVAFFSSVTDASGIAHVTHLGGLLAGYGYLRATRLRLHPWAEVKYRYVKWRMGRLRKKFDVHQGGRAGQRNGPIH
jgi:membrane associated rhomboid family serine protease